MTRFLLDAHLDIAWNATGFDRDQRRTVAELRRSEARLEGKGRGHNTVSLPEMHRAGAGVCLATLLSRALPENYVSGDPTNAHPGISQRGNRKVILRENIDHTSQQIACAVAQGQLAYYRLLEQDGLMVQIADAGTLQRLASQWQTALRAGADTASLPIGYILSMEGADPIVNPQQARWWWQQGLRTLCLAHYGPSAYAMGTGFDGPLTPAGVELLKVLDELGMILDLVHTADQAITQALDQFSGSVFVSHGNCRALVPGDRQISDEQIRAIAQRGGVIGLVTDNWMLLKGYVYGQTPNTAISLGTMADHAEHICQLTGSRQHVALGSDLDGGYGTEQCPHDLDTIADLQKLGDILSQRGWTDAELDGFFHQNWLNFFGKALPQ